jgi:hypothetical protein
MFRPPWRRPLAAHLSPLISFAQNESWDVYVVAIPAALAWLDTDALRCLARSSGAQRVPPPTDAEFSPRGGCPASCNTINRRAASIDDILAFRLLNEAIGRSVPVVVLPLVNDSLAAHPAYRRNIAVLTLLAVTFVSSSTRDGDTAGEWIPNSVTTAAILTGQFRSMGHTNFSYRMPETTLAAVGRRTRQRGLLPSEPSPDGKPLRGLLPGLLSRRGHGGVSIH